MDQANIAGLQPEKVSLQAGENYYWCACGKSAKQPLCDGSHKGSTFTPKKITPTANEEAYLCMCKQTKNPPYCDGSHKHC